jgi:hypothetical protein
MKAIAAVCAAVGLTLAVGPAANAADILQTYAFAGTLVKTLNGDSTVTGRFTLDLTTDKVDGFDFTTPAGEIDGAHGGLSEDFSFNPLGDFVDLTFVGGARSIDALNLIFASDGPLISDDDLVNKIKISNRPTIFLTSNQACGSLFHACGGKDLFASGFTSGAVTAVPEPAGWAMLLLGFFGLGAMLRSRRARTAVTA